MLRKTMVVGASGGMGYSIVKELSNRGMEVVAFARNKEKLQKLFEGDSNVSIYAGDASSREELKNASKGVDVIFHALNIPYAEWEMKLIGLTENIVTVAKEVSAKLAVVDNIYAYGMNPGRPVNEDTYKKPHTKKGKIRLEMARVIKESGVPYLIAHFPDFYGPHVENGQLNYMLRGVVSDKKTGFIGKKSTPREHIYTPDGAKAIVELSLREEAYNQHWNIPAAGVITGEDVIKVIREVTGYERRVGTITKNMIRLVGVFDKQMREFVEMQYLNEDPVVLDGSKYEKIIGPIPGTPYQEGLKETITSMSNN